MYVHCTYLYVNLKPTQEGKGKGGREGEEQLDRGRKLTRKYFLV